MRPFKRKARPTDASEGQFPDAAPIRVQCQISSFLEAAQDTFFKDEVRPNTPDGGEDGFHADDGASVLSDLTPLPSDDECAPPSEDDAGFVTAGSDKPPTSKRAKVAKGKRAIRVLEPFPPASQPRINDLPCPPRLEPSLNPTPGELAVPTRSEQKGRKKKSPGQVHAHNLHRREKRREQREAFLREHSGVKEVSWKRRGEDRPKQMGAFDAFLLPAAKGAWVGKKQFIKPEKRDLASCVAAGIQVVPWEGTTTHPVLDSENQMFMLLGAKPRKNTWSTVIERAGRLVSKARQRISFTKKQRIHGRGSFPLAASGINHGGGTEGPCNIANPPKTQQIMDALLQSHEFRCIQGHADNLFKTCNPLMHKVYDDVLTFVVDSDATLRRVYSNSPFAATTVNFGDQAVLNDHTDPHNAPFGWCRVTAMGNYDYRLGGHLVLWDLGLAFEFPPGATIFIPSAILVHSNIAIQPGETRYSVTSYSAGGLFRWTAYGGRTDEEYDEEFGKDVGRRERREHAQTAWREAMKYFPVWKQG